MLWKCIVLFYAIFYSIKKKKKHEKLSSFHLILHLSLLFLSPHTKLGDELKATNLKRQTGDEFIDLSGNQALMLQVAKKIQVDENIDDTS